MHERGCISGTEEQNYELSGHNANSRNSGDLRAMDPAINEASPSPIREQNFEPVGDLKRLSARGAAVTFGAQTLRFVFTFGPQLWLARLLSPADFGLVAMAAPVAGFVNIFKDLGLSQATIQRKEISQRDLSSLFWINGGTSCVLALLMIALAPGAAWMYHDSRVTAIIWALALLLPFGGFAAQSVAIMNRRMQFLALGFVDVISVFLGAVAGILAAEHGAGYWSLVFQQAVISISTLCIALAVSRWRPSRPAFGNEIHSLLRFGGHVTAFNVLNYFSLYFDNVLVGILSGPEALGFFDRAFRLMVAPLVQVSSPISRVAVPMLSRLQDDDEAFRRAYLRMLQFLLLFTGPGFACISVLPTDVTVVLLGNHWLASAPMIRWLSIAGYVSTFTIASCWVLVSRNRVAEQTKCGLISSSLVMAALMAGIHWGPVGICVSYAVFAPLVHGTFVFVSSQSGPVRLKDVFSAAYPILGPVAVSAAILALASSSVPGGPATKVVVGLSASYSCTGALLFALPSGRSALRDLWNLRSALWMAAK